MQKKRERKADETFNWVKHEPSCTASLPLIRSSCESNRVKSCQSCFFLSSFLTGDHMKRERERENLS